MKRSATIFILSFCLHTAFSCVMDIESDGSNVATYKTEMITRLFTIKN